MMKSLFKFLILAVFLQGISFSGFAFKKTFKVLIFSKTTGFRHKSIGPGVAAIQKLGKENGFEAVATEDASVFSYKNLKQFKCLIFLNPTGDNLFNEEQKAAFQKYIRNGGGFVGIHAATDCLYNWDWYGKMVGAYFASHPAIQEAKLDILIKDHPSTISIPSPWMHKDEWYNFKSISQDTKKLINLDEKSYRGGKNGEAHPISWFHEYDGGRIFYTGLGHTEEAYKDETFLKHVLGGIKYATGL